MSTSLPESLDALKGKIAAIAQQPVNEHVAAYEEIHVDLQRALSEIEGL